MKVAPGAQIDIIKLRFFLDVALCQIFSMFSIWYRSASFWTFTRELLLSVP
jgi:hypothetical protein